MSTGRTHTLASALILLATAASAQQAGVAGTLHNLSVSGPGAVKALAETEVCKFCHIPHNAIVPKPLWGHALSQVPSYAVPQMRRQGQMWEPPQPDAASRLCLSCHDGTVALGDLGRGRRVAMTGGGSLTPGRPGFLGTDLSGSHPVSFTVPDETTTPTGPDVDMGLKPLSAIRADGQVRLDAAGKMQCTTCHDPHSDRNFQPGVVPHFWVKPTVTEVCQTCHELR